MSLMLVLEMPQFRKYLPEYLPKSVELLTSAGCSFCGVCGNSCPSSVILSLSQGKNQRLDFNKMILLTLNVYCAIETFLHILDVSVGNFVQLCHWIFLLFKAERGWSGPGKFCFPFVSAGFKIYLASHNFICGQNKKIKPELPVLSHKGKTAQQGGMVSNKHLFSSVSRTVHTALYRTAR